MTISSSCVHVLATRGVLFLNHRETFHTGKSKNVRIIRLVVVYWIQNYMEIVCITDECSLRIKQTSHPNFYVDFEMGCSMNNDAVMQMDDQLVSIHVLWEPGSCKGTKEDMLNFVLIHMYMLKLFKRDTIFTLAQYGSRDLK